MAGWRSQWQRRSSIDVLVPRAPRFPFVPAEAGTQGPSILISPSLGCRRGTNGITFLPRLKERRPKERQQAPADQDPDPHRQRRCRNELDPARHIGKRAECLHLAEGSRSVKGQDIEARDAHERRLEIESIVVGVLVGMAEEEYDAG